MESQTLMLKKEKFELKENKPLNKDSKKNTGSKSKKMFLAYLSIFFLSLSLIFVSANITGYSIAENYQTANLFSAILFVGGLIFAYSYFRYKK